jgi:hypothetical protein
MINPFDRRQAEHDDTIKLDWRDPHSTGRRAYDLVWVPIDGVEQWTPRYIAREEPSVT